MATRAPGSGQRRCNPAAEGGKHCGHVPNGANGEINLPGQDVAISARRLPPVKVNTRCGPDRRFYSIALANGSH